MSLSVHLPTSLEERLANFCQTHGISQGEAIERALQRFLSEPAALTPYELGVEGFGADQSHGGDIAKNSQRLLRERFRDPVAR